MLEGEGVLTTLVDFTVVVVTLATTFWVVVGRCVVVVVVEVSTSLSFDLKNPVMPLKKPFFLVVVSGASVVVVVLGMAGCWLKSDSEYASEWIWFCWRLSCC